MSKNELPLAGVRVAEFSHMVMGPTCGLVLGDLGADVVKVEPNPAGDHTRRVPGSGAGFFVMFNRNKRSLALNLKSSEGLEIARRLVRRSDVLIENFRPGAMDKLGLGYEAMKADNPGLIYTSAKGFLPGPYEHRTALDEVVQMMTGLAFMTGPRGRPLRVGASVNDIMGGMFAAIAVLAALKERDRTGKGQYVSSGLFENCALLMGQNMAQYLVTGKPVPPMPDRLAAWSVYDVFDCAGGDQLFVGVVTDTQWRVFCEAFGFADFAADESLATNTQRCHARDRIMPRLRELFASMPRDVLAEKIAAIGLPYSPIAKPEDLIEDAHLKASGGLLPITLPDGRQVELPALPLSMGGRRFGIHHDVLRVGEHASEVLDELGYDADAIRDLEARGIIGLDPGSPATRAAE